MGWVEYAKFFDVFSLWNEWFMERMTRRGLDMILTVEARRERFTIESMEATEAGVA